MYGFGLAAFGGGHFDPTPALGDRQDGAGDSIPRVVDPGGGTRKNRAAFPGVVDRVLGAPGSAERRIREAHVTGEIDSLDLVVLSEHADGLVAAGPQGTPREADGALELGGRVGLAIGSAARDD